MHTMPACTQAHTRTHHEGSTRTHHEAHPRATHPGDPAQRAAHSHSKKSGQRVQQPRAGASYWLPGTREPQQHSRAPATAQGVLLLARQSRVWGMLNGALQLPLQLRGMQATCARPHLKK